MDELSNDIIDMIITNFYFGDVKFLYKLRRVNKYLNHI